MPLLKSKPSKNPWAALDKEMHQPFNRLPPGKGWRTTRELMAAWGVGRDKCYDQIRGLIERGKLERFDGHRDSLRCVWYRVK